MSQTSEIIDLSRFRLSPLMLAQEGKCFYCGTFMIYEVFRGDWHPRLVSRDHFIPRSLGASLRDNYVFACSECNSRAHHELPTREELRRFIDLYTKAKFSYRFVVIRLAELGVTLDPGTNFIESMIS